MLGVNVVPADLVATTVVIVTLTVDNTELGEAKEDKSFGYETWVTPCVGLGTVNADFGAPVSNCCI